MLEKNQSKLKKIDLHQSFKGFISWLSGFLAGVQSEDFFYHGGKFRKRELFSWFSRSEGARKGPGELNCTSVFFRWTAASCQPTPHSLSPSPNMVLNSICWLIINYLKATTIQYLSKSPSASNKSFGRWTFRGHWESNQSTSFSFSSHWLEHMLFYSLIMWVSNKTGLLGWWSCV